MIKKTLISDSFKRLLILTFLLIELASVGFSTYRYFNDKYRTLEYKHELALSDERVEQILLEQKSDTQTHILLISIIIALAGGFSYIVYFKQIKRVKEEFTDFANIVKTSIKEHKKIDLKDELKGTEFDQISKSLNQILDEFFTKENYNSLTKLPNKKHFFRLYSNLFVSEKKQVILVYIYLKNYTELIGTRSFELADKIIIQLAQRLTKFASKLSHATVGKVSGNGDFLLAYPCDCSLDSQIDEMAKMLYECTSTSINFGDDGNYRIEIALGFLQSKSQNDEAINNAYRAALLASTQKDKFYCNFSQELMRQAQYDAQLQSDLIEAISGEKLHILYQAKVSIDGKKVVGAEALIRWKRENRFENTERFIKLAEKSDLIIDIERFVIIGVCKELARLKQKQINVPISINITAKHLRKDDFVEFIAQNCEKYGIEPSLIDIELTERHKIEKDDLEHLQEIRRLGCTISVDDFGKDYSSFSYLNEFPIDNVKIDKSFVDGLRTHNLKAINENSITIIQSIVRLAKKLDKTVVAEGVEDLEQVKVLRLLGCDELQGFYFNKGSEKLDEFIAEFENESAY